MGTSWYHDEKQGTQEEDRFSGFRGMITRSFLEILISTGKESRSTVPKAVGIVEFKFN